MFESIQNFEDLKLLSDDYTQMLLKRVSMNTLAKALVDLKHSDEVYLKFHNNFDEKQTRNYYKELSKLGIVSPESIEFAKNRILQDLKRLSDEIEYRKTHNKIQSFFHWDFPIIWNDFFYDYLIKIFPKFIRSKFTVRLFKNLSKSFGKLTDALDKFVLVSNLERLDDLFKIDEVIQFNNVKDLKSLINFKKIDDKKCRWSCPETQKINKKTLKKTSYLLSCLTIIISDLRKIENKSENLEELFVTLKNFRSVTYNIFKEKLEEKSDKEYTIGTKDKKKVLYYISNHEDDSTTYFLNDFENEKDVLSPITNTLDYHEVFKDDAEDDLKDYREIYNLKDHTKTLKNNHRIIVKDDLKEAVILTLTKKINKE